VSSKLKGNAKRNKKKEGREEKKCNIILEYWK
jgi:hypothetical protein